MRSPNLNIAPRTPGINMSGAARVNPTIGTRPIGVGRTNPVRSVPKINVRSTLPYARYSPNLYPPCSDGFREGGCSDGPVLSVEGGGSGSGSKTSKKDNHGPRRDVAQTMLNMRTVPNEIVAEIDGALSDAQADELARRHGLVRVQSQSFALIGGTIGLFRIADRRSMETVNRELAADTSFRTLQPNFRYVLQGQKAAEGDPAQYAVAKLRLPEAHKLADGANVTVAVIDSGIDVKHPELANTVADSFDALGSKEGPHVHGTGVAGAIASHARLMGSAPAVRILAIRAFGKTQSGAESTSFVVLKGLDYAAEHGAQIINMSFAGPKDTLIERGIAALAAKGVVMVAAAGNAGAKSPPLYPAANANVIAVSATDAQDKLFAASNRGDYVAVAAPGVDIFLPAPDEKYQITSGTSFSAAFVSGLAALMLERSPALKPQDLRAILTKTAHDLGSPGRDDLFGAGEADAFAAVSAVAAVPVATVTDPPAVEKASDPQVPVTRALNEPAATLASEKPAVGEPDHPAAQ